MSILKKAMAGVCCLCTAFSLCACGGGENFQSEVVDLENDILSGTLNLRVWDGGYGLKWLDNVIVEFNEKYPDWKHSTVYYEMQKSRLAALYERERIKPSEEQGIVDN